MKEYPIFNKIILILSVFIFIGFSILVGLYGDGIIYLNKSIRELLQLNICFSAFAFCIAGYQRLKINGEFGK
jgi:hypothetical protein